MAKLHRVNIWPEAVGDIALAVAGVEPDYFVRALRRDNRDELTIAFTSRRPGEEWPAIKDTVEQRLKDRLGVRIATEVLAPGP
jgi:phenylacetate-coenzyme A ligase PaaK-like adenylate-forming protein